VSSPRGPYAKTPRVREGILDSALAVFSEAGFRGTTMKAVAEHAQISQRGLVHHFPTKEALLMALLERHEAENAAKTPVEPSADVLTALMRIARDNSAKPGMLELHSILSAEATSVDHPAHDYFTQRYESYREYLIATFEAMRSNGELRSELPVAVLASVLIAIQDGLQVQWLYNPGAVDVEATMLAVIDALARRSPAGQS
jgi:AcrR family transcriptional regulator